MWHLNQVGVSNSNSSHQVENMGRKHVSSFALILPLLASTVDAASDPARPRGVAPECMLHPRKLIDSCNGRSSAC